MSWEISPELVNPPLKLLGVVASLEAQEFQRHHVGNSAASQALELTVICLFKWCKAAHIQGLKDKARTHKVETQEGI